MRVDPRATPAQLRWPLLDDEHLLLCDGRLKAALGWSEGLAPIFAGDSELETVFGREALHDLRGAAGLSQVDEGGVIGGCVTLGGIRHLVHLRRAAGTTILRLRPDSLDTGAMLDPMLPLSMLLRNMERCAPQDRAARACANLRSLIGARDMGLMRLQPGMAIGLHPGRALDPGALSPDHVAVLEELGHTSPVLHLDDTLRPMRDIAMTKPLHLAAPGHDLDFLPRPLLLVTAPRPDGGSHCFFCETFARTPLPLRLSSALELFARLAGMVLPLEPGPDGT